MVEVCFIYCHGEVYNQATHLLNYEYCRTERQYRYEDGLLSKLAVLIFLQQLHFKVKNSYS